MKHILIIAIVLSLTLGQAPLSIAECKMPEKTASKDFERLKAIAGHWEGSMMEDGKEVPVNVDYRVSSGGSAVVETLFPGTPHEMVSMYHDEDGKLVMTHYCMLGNRPKMALLKSTPDEMDFVFSHGQKGIQEKKDAHMHSLRITFSNPDLITERWAGFENGKENHASVFTLKRTG